MLVMFKKGCFEVKSVSSTSILDNKVAPVIGLVGQNEKKDLLNLKSQGYIMILHKNVEYTKIRSAQWKSREMPI